MPFELFPVKDSWSLDPHLQDTLLASADPAWEPSPSLCHRGKDGRLYVDVLARLETDKRGELLPIPAEIRQVCTIGDIVTGLVAVEEIEDARKQVASLKSATDLFLNLHYSVPASGCNPAALQKALPRFPGLDGSGVVIGIVDVGCDFRHQNFRLPSGDSRLLFLWDQSEHDDATQAPQPYGYGRELDTVTINKALREPDPYQVLGYAPTVSAHGTHVMDIAAGNGREPDLLDGEPSRGPVTDSAPGVAPNALLVFVHLKTDETSFLGNSRHLLEAVDYVFRKADELDLPAVVNLSLSTTGGPHDGSTLVERGFENLLQKPGRAIVISAGNAYGKASHVEGAVRADEPFTLTWLTDPLSERNEMEAWYDNEHRLTATLIAPDETRLSPVERGQTADLYEDGKRVGRISHRADDPNNRSHQIDLRVPQPKVANATGIAVPERWILELSTKEREVPFHAWIEQNDRGLARFEGKTTASCTLGSISCGESTLVAGAFNTSERAALRLSWEGTAAGPTRDGREKPEVSAPGAKIVAARAHGGTTVMSGTSMAAAHVTGLVALLFQLAERAGLGRLDIQTTRRAVVDAMSAWDPRLGKGQSRGDVALAALLRPAEAAPSDRATASSQTKKQAKAVPPAPVGAKGGNGYRPTREAELVKGGLLTTVSGQKFTVKFEPVEA